MIFPPPGSSILKAMPQKVVRNVDEGIDFAALHLWPVMILPSFTIRAEGSAIAYDIDDLRNKLHHALFVSPVAECMLVARDPD